MVKEFLHGRAKLYLAVSTANILAYAAGIMLGWSSPILRKLSMSGDDNPLSEPITDSQYSWIGGLLSLGAAIGPYPFAFLQDNIGRKYTLLIIGIPFVAAYLMAAFAKHVAWFLALRMIVGISLGGMFTVLPTYIAEVSDSSVRGMLGASMNNFLCIGLLTSYVLGAYLPVIWFNIIAAIFSATFLVLFFIFIPDSPYYLMKKNREQAESALAFLRSKKIPEIQNELQEIKETVDEGTKSAATFLDIFKSRGTTKALIISVMLLIFQQLSGINIVQFYSQDIFEASGTTLSSEIPPIIIGSVQFLSSFVSPIAVERLGRKMLLMVSAVGMVISEVVLGVYFYLKDDGKNVDSISFLPILTLVIYMISYNTGFGPLPWTVMAELFPTSIKSAASSFTASACWFVSFLLTFFFDSVSKEIGMYGSFWLFSGCTVVAFIFTLIYVPETKGKSFQEIQDILSS